MKCNKLQVLQTVTLPNSLSIISALSSVNGVLHSETVGISLEPAYTKLAYGNSDPGGVGVSTSSDTPVGVNGSTKTSSTVGLAANKPFFQRPAPVVTTSSTTTTSTKSDIPGKTDGGARDIVRNQVHLD
ncbi:Protein PRRC2C [Schistosoma japonicum]|nr:Protein PRRC2C [Schistosoma japonicum]